MSAPNRPTGAWPPTMHASAFGTLSPSRHDAEGCLLVRVVLPWAWRSSDSQPLPAFDPNSDIEKSEARIPAGDAPFAHASGRPFACDTGTRSKIWKPAVRQALRRMRQLIAQRWQLIEDHQDCRSDRAGRSRNRTSPALHMPLPRARAHTPRGSRAIL
jgi:hypothetical protein